MKLKEELVKFPKEILYETYLKIVYDYKYYDNITKNKMLDEIIKEYNQPNFTYHMCTAKELDFLKYAINKKLTKKDLEKYEWEITSLYKKCIFSLVDLAVYEEQKENVLDALKTYEQNGKNKVEDLVIFMIGKIRTNGSMLTKALSSIVENITNIKEKDIDHIMGMPLFHFYCEFSSIYLDSIGKEMEQVSYRDYYEILDDLDEARKNYGIAGTLPFNIKDDFDIFYYGFPIGKEKVNKMYNEINKREEKIVLFKIIDEARVLNDRKIINMLPDKRLIRVINEGLDECPCAAMNGFTPNEYNNQMIEQIDLDKEFIYIPQNNAHLCKSDADHYYKLYFALLDYINNKIKIHPEMGKIYKQEGLSPEKLNDIDEYLWQHKEEIIDEFIAKNEYNFTDKELSEINEFKKSVTSEYFVIAGFDREYTKILSDDGKIYMVKGIRANFDEIMNPYEIPKIISTTLLMFKGNIIFKSFYNNIDIVFGNDIKKEIVDQMHNSMTYYHL